LGTKVVTSDKVCIGEIGGFAIVFVKLVPPGLKELVVRGKNIFTNQAFVGIFRDIRIDGRSTQQREYRRVFKWGFLCAL